MPLEEIASKEQIERLIERTSEGGTEIVKLFGKGSAFFSPAWSAIVMAECCLKDKRRVLPCLAYCEGEYGVEGLFLGVPALIGAQGIERIFEIRLTDDERQLLAKTVDGIRKSASRTKL